MRIRDKKLIAAAGFLIAAFTLASSFKTEVTVTKTMKMNAVSYSELTAGIQTVLNAAEESAVNEEEEVDVHEEIQEVLNEGVVQNNIPGYDWNVMAMANVEESVNMRATPDPEGEIVGKLPKGAAGTIVEGTEGWTKLSSGAVEGWVSDDFLLFGTDAEAKAQELGTSKATIMTETLRIRMEPSEDAGVYDLAELGASYTVVEQLDGWVGIRVGENTGYVSSEFVSVEFQLAGARTIEEIRAEEEKARQEAEAEKKAAEEKQRREAEKKAQKSTEKGTEKKAANSSDVSILAALVQLEAGGESYEGKLAVASVVMNRVRSGGYPNSVQGVVYQSGQFPPASGGRMASLVANGAGADCVKAAQQAIGGVSNIGSLKHFHSARLGGSVVIGNHAFY